VILVGDIGGTRARLCLLGPTGRVARREVFESRTFPSLEAVAARFLGVPAPRVSAAAFGVAGPVVNGRCVATNLPWIVDERVLSRRLGIKRVTLVNDLVALGVGAIAVGPSKRRVVNGARPPRARGANVAVIAAGTGLGEALLVWDAAGRGRGRLVPTGTEGSHVEFGPRDEVEIELLRFVRERYGHASYERIVSGAGLGVLYDFFLEAKRMKERPEIVDALAAAPDRNAAISNLGQEGRSEPAAQAVERFVSIYGAEAGNLALKGLATGGVLVCGNIAAKMLPAIERGGFMKAFVDKGRFRPVMEKIPVAVVLDPDVGLSGAKRIAMGTAG
jgi:glucokinase